MQLVATAFAVFLNSLSGAPAGHGIAQEPQRFKVAYENNLIDFAVKENQIDRESVCRQSSDDVHKQCLGNANALFKETCEQLQLRGLQDQPSSPAYAFCRAALQLQGHPGGISLVSQSSLDSLFLARQQCSEYTLRAKDTGSGVHAQLRDSACQKARRLSKAPATSHQMASR